jgi:hypothetical protein
MIFKRRNHKLPKFPQEVIPTFKALCKRLSEEEVRELRKSLDANFQELFRDSKDNEYIDLDVAKLLYERCLYLLESYNEYSADKQKYIVGAVSYIAIADDPFNDTVFASGFHDDKLIMNFVLEELGIEGKFLPVK